MNEDREKQESSFAKATEDKQAELNEEVKRHMEFMQNLGWGVKYVLCLGTAMGGFFALLHTRGDFGDVPMVLGIVGLAVLFKQGV